MVPISSFVRRNFVLSCHASLTNLSVLDGEGGGKLRNTDSERR